jgi:hypothetical protein
MTSVRSCSSSLHGVRSRSEFDDGAMGYFQSTSPIMREVLFSLKDEPEYYKSTYPKELAIRVKSWLVTKFARGVYKLLLSRSFRQDRKEFTYEMVSLWA